MFDVILIGCGITGAVTAYELSKYRLSVAVLERENGGVVRGFLDRHSDFTLEAFQLPGPAGAVESGMLTLWPHIHGTDGFFIAKLRRN